MSVAVKDGRNETLQGLLSGHQSAQAPLDMSIPSHIVCYLFKPPGDVEINAKSLWFIGLAKLSR